MNNNNYLLIIQQQIEDSFEIHLINEDFYFRWSSLITINYLTEISNKLGLYKSIKVLWKMFKNFIKGISNEISLEIFTPEEVLFKKNGKYIQLSEEENKNKRYILLNQKTEFEEFTFPFLLFWNPFLNEELLEIIYQFKNEISFLKDSIKENSPCCKVQKKCEINFLKKKKKFKNFENMTNNQLKKINKNVHKF